MEVLLNVKEHDIKAFARDVIAQRPCREPPCDLESRSPLDRLQLFLFAALRSLLMAGVVSRERPELCPPVDLRKMGALILRDACERARNKYKPDLKLLGHSYVSRCALPFQTVRTHHEELLMKEHLYQWDLLAMLYNLDLFFEDNPLPAPALFTDEMPEHFSCVFPRGGSLRYLATPEPVTLELVQTQKSIEIVQPAQQVAIALWKGSSRHLDCPRRTFVKNGGKCLSLIADIISATACGDVSPPLVIEDLIYVQIRNALLPLLADMREDGACQMFAVVGAPCLGKSTDIRNIETRLKSLGKTVYAEDKGIDRFALPWVASFTRDVFYSAIEGVGPMTADMIEMQLTKEFTEDCLQRICRVATQLLVMRREKKIPDVVILDRSHFIDAHLYIVATLAASGQYTVSNATIVADATVESAFKLARDHLVRYFGQDMAHIMFSLEPKNTNCINLLYHTNPCHNELNAWGALFSQRGKSCDTVCRDAPEAMTCKALDYEGAQLATSGAMKTSFLVNGLAIYYAPKVFRNVVPIKKSPMLLCDLTASDLSPERVAAALEDATELTERIIKQIVDILAGRTDLGGVEVEMHARFIKGVDKAHDEILSADSILRKFLARNAIKELPTIGRKRARLENEDDG